MQRQLAAAGDFGTLTTDTQTVGKWNNIRVVDGVKFPTIQAAIDDLSALGAGEVVIPCGTYNLSDTTLNVSNLVVRGSGVCTVVQPSGGAGHYAFIMGDANPSTKSYLQLRNLAIACPGGGDLTNGILVHNGLSVGIVLSNLRIRQCKTHIQWGELSGTQGTFDGFREQLDIDLQGTQIGIDIYGGTAGSNGLTISNSSIRNGTLSTGASIGIRNQGPGRETGNREQLYRVHARWLHRSAQHEWDSEPYYYHGQLHGDVRWGGLAARHRFRRYGYRVCKQLHEPDILAFQLCHQDCERSHWSPDCQQHIQRRSNGRHQ